MIWGLLLADPRELWSMLKLMLWAFNLYLSRFLRWSSGFWLRRPFKSFVFILFFRVLMLRTDNSSLIVTSPQSTGFLYWYLEFSVILERYSDWIKVWPSGPWLTSTLLPRKSFYSATGASLPLLVGTKIETLSSSGFFSFFSCYRIPDIFIKVIISEVSLF